MLKNLKILILIITFLYQSSILAKTNDSNDFNHRYLSNYFSALISYDNQNNDKALKFFNLSKRLVNKHDNFLKEFSISLVEGGYVSKAIYKIKNSKNLKQIDFVEAQILLIVDSFINEDFDRVDKILKKLQTYEDDGSYDFIVYKILESYFMLFKNNEIISKKKYNFGKLFSITEAFQNCYVGSKDTNSSFINLINSSEGNYSRYLFFYLSKLLQDKDYSTVKQISKTIDPLSNGLLISQTQIWIEKFEYEKIVNSFSCKNKNHLLSEFFFLISNLYSADEDYKKSNFYLNISNFLNPKFYYNKSLLAENYFITDNYISSKKVLNVFSENDEIYNWFKIKKKSQIISEQKSEKEALDFLEIQFEKINKPSDKIKFDMANLYKNSKKYDEAIKLYSDLLKNIKKNSNVHADILYRRGGSYERIKKFKKSDNDLLLSLKINPNEPYVMNYLAYSWLERDHKIDEALSMLKKAYNQKKNDPYIIDSIGWAYYLKKDYQRAEKYLIKAVELMPDDPIVNDHYGDILWKLEKKLQARYFWKNVLKLKETDEQMKILIKEKLLKGLDKI